MEDRETIAAVNRSGTRVIHVAAGHGCETEIPPLSKVMAWAHAVVAVAAGDRVLVLLTPGTEVHLEMHLKTVDI